MLLGLNINKKKLLLFLIPCLTGAALILVLFGITFQKSFYKGVLIDGINLSGQDKISAQNLIQRRINEINKTQKLVLKYRDIQWKYTFEDISFKFLSGKTIEKAYEIGRAGGPISRFLRILHLRIEPVNLPLESTYDEQKISNILSDIKRQIDKKEKNAAASYKKGEIIICKEEIGRNLPIDNNINLVENQLQNGHFIIELNVEEIVPEVTLEKIGEIRNVLSSFTTVFNPGDINRSYNIRLACEKINGTVLFSQDIFSMNKALGPRTIENGYKEAPVIYKNELIPGAGGGVCQVTTTLYNAVLLSKIEVLERTHHTLPLGYVKPSQDATIAEDYIDFKFQNSTSYPICISAEVVGSNLNIRLLGKKEDNGYTVKLRSEVLEQTPPEEELIVDNVLADNEKVTVREGKNGLKSVLYREIFDKNGQLVQSERISEDVYQPIKGQFKVNQKVFDEQKSLNNK